MCNTAPVLSHRQHLPRWPWRHPWLPLDRFRGGRQLFQPNAFGAVDATMALEVQHSGAGNRGRHHARFHHFAGESYDTIGPYDPPWDKFVIGHIEQGHGRRIGGGAVRPGTRLLYTIATHHTTATAAAYSGAVPSIRATNNGSSCDGGGTHNKAFGWMARIYSKAP